MVATVVELVFPMLLAQSRPLPRKLGLGLGLLFHFLIALTPPPNNAGGFSVGAIVRYVFFLPVATTATMSTLPTLASFISLSRLVALGSLGLGVGIAASDGKVTLAGSLPVCVVLLLVYIRALIYLSCQSPSDPNLSVGTSSAGLCPASHPRRHFNAPEQTCAGGEWVTVEPGHLLCIRPFHAFSDRKTWRLATCSPTSMGQPQLSRGRTIFSFPPGFCRHTTSTLPPSTTRLPAESSRCFTRPVSGSGISTPLSPPRCSTHVPARCSHTLGTRPASLARRRLESLAPFQV